MTLARCGSCDPRRRRTCWRSATASFWPTAIRWPSSRRPPTRPHDPVLRATEPRWSATSRHPRTVRGSPGQSRTPTNRTSAAIVRVSVRRPIRSRLACRQVRRPAKDVVLDACETLAGAPADCREACNSERLASRASDAPNGRGANITLPLHRRSYGRSRSAACRSSCCSCAHGALDYDAVHFKRGSEMPKRPDVGVIAEQVIERLKPIEDQVTHTNQRLTDELGRLRDAVKDLERAIVSRLSGAQAPPAEPTARAQRQTAGTRSRASTRPSARKRAIAPRGQNQAKIVEALRGSEPMTASEIARRTGVATATVSTTVTKMAKTGQLTKAERGYKLAS